MGFNTLSWPSRIRLLKNNLFLYGTELLSSLSEEQVFQGVSRVASNLLKEREPDLVAPQERKPILFIKRDRIANTLCTLEVVVK